MIFEQRKKNLSYRLTDYLLDFSRCLILLLLDDFVFAPAVSDGRVNVVILLYYLGLIKYRCIYATSDNKSLLSMKSLLSFSNSSREGGGRGRKKRKRRFL